MASRNELRVPTPVRDRRQYSEVTSLGRVRPAWAGRPSQCCRPPQARRLGRAEQGVLSVHTAVPVPSDSAGRDACPILRDPVDLPAHLVRDRHVLGRPRGRTDRRGRICRRGAMRRAARRRGRLGGGIARRRTATSTARLAIDALNRNDLVIVQHEYGLYDGADGESVIELMAAIEAPIVVVAHTVLSGTDHEPAPGARASCAVAPTPSWS